MKQNLFKTVLIAGGILMGSAFAQAGGVIGEGLNTPMGEVEVGQTYELTEMGQYYTFVPTSTGAILVQTNYSGNPEAIYYPNSLNTYFFLQPSPAEPGAYGDMYAAQRAEIENGGYQFIFSVNAGTQYLFAYTGDMGDLKTSLSFSVVGSYDQTIDDVMIDCIPSPGTAYDYASGIPDVLMEFEKPLASIEGVALSYTDKNGQEQSIEIPFSYESGWKIENKILDVKIAHSLNNEIYLQAKNNADTSKPFYINVFKAMCATGPVSSANFKAGQEYINFDGEGNFSIEYYFGENVNLVSSEFPTTFYSYWSPGTQDGMATLTFNGPVSNRGGEVTVTMGMHQVGSVSSGDDPDPYWNVDYTFNEDNTVMILNFTGVNYADALTKNYSNVTVMVTGLTGENGLTVILSEDGYNSVNQIIPYVNEPYEGAELPDYMTGTPTVNPASNSVLRELQEVVVTWDNAVSLVAGMTPEATVQLGNVAPQRIPLVVENGSLVIDLTQLSIPDGRFTGTCIVNVPAGIVKNATGEVSEALTLIYTLAIVPSTGGDEPGDEPGDDQPTVSIDSIEAATGEVVIYNLNGVKVNGDVKSLNPGIYVINGKKVVIK